MFQSVPNVSEARNEATVQLLSDAIASTAGVSLLNVSPDVDHNRTVFTFVSESADAMFQATMAMYEAAVPRIDLRTHRGAHPRVGAVDVVPFVPLRGSDMSECVSLAERVGESVAQRFGIPVYLYEHAATADYRRELPAIRSGGFEGFPEKIADERWKPDFGPDKVHETAGVSVIGARVPLIAFNVQLATDRIEIAEKIARSVRGVSGGLRFVRALPIRLTHRGIVQVSLNLLDFRRTPIHRAFLIVREEAARYGVEVLSSEIIGLVPAEALYAAAEWHLQIENFRPEIVLERRIAQLKN